MAFNPNIDILSIRRVAVPYSLDKTDPNSVNWIIAPAFSTEFGLLSLGYAVIDRGDIDSILKEHKLSLVGISAPEEAAKIGQILGVQGIVIPSVAPGDEPNVKLVDITTGRIVWNVTGPAPFDKLADDLGNKGWKHHQGYQSWNENANAYRLAFSANLSRRKTIQRIGVLPFYSGHGLRSQQGSQSSDVEIVRLDGGLQSDKVAGDMLAVGFDVIERNHLSRVLDELKLSMSGALTQENAQQIQKVLNIQALVVGAAFKYVSNPTIVVKFIHLESGEILCIYQGRRGDFAKAAVSIKKAFSETVSQ
ncbi:MAG: hypothetical protein HY922_13235 [Elusimicrobia bacterium]|nr:hypothetical protein [Elusimicrobiota bacterium]